MQDPDMKKPTTKTRKTGRLPAVPLPDVLGHLRLAVSRFLHMTKFLVFVNIYSVRLLGMAIFVIVSSFPS